MAAEGVNSLVSTQKSSDQLQVILHPLVLLNISDYITRHALRKQEGPVVGALIGQQNTREITIEHAFDCKLETSNNGDVVLDLPWFHKRLEQMKTVHKDRELDFVGLWVLLPKSGPNPKVLALHAQTFDINESSVLLGFHPDEVSEPSVGGKLPLTIYEYVDEAADQSSAPAQNQANNEDSEMTDGDQAATAKAIGVAKKFRELPYTVETGEAEMISVDFVAKGGANANASATAPAEDKTAKAATSKEAMPSSSKGKAAVTPNAETASATDVMSREDEELIATLTAKANAIKMLQSRIQLITKYLESLPPAYLSSDATDAPAVSNGTHTTPSPTILRSIQALVHRLPLLAPPSTVDALRQELLSESNDVHLISLMNDVVQSLAEVRDLGRKFAIVEQARNQRGGKGAHGESSFHGLGSRDMDDLLNTGRGKGTWIPG